MDVAPEIDADSSVFVETETIIENPDNVLPIPSFDWRPPRDLRPNEDEPQLPDLSHAPRGFAVYDEFLWNRAITADWSRRWGGVANWPHSLEIELERLKSRGPEGISTFYRRLWQHEHRGRYLLYEIQKQTIMTLPPNDEAIMQLWNLQQDQVMVLTRGLTIMELTGSMALRHLSIGGGELDGAVPSALLAPNTALYPTRRDPEVEKDEEDVEIYLKSGE